MKKLDENEWKQIPIGKIFTNNHGKRLVKSKRKPGVVPLLTAGENNNGVAEFIELDGMPVYSSFISIDMFGNSFHHPYEATGDDNIYFFSNNMLSKSEKLFITTPIKKQAIKFSYGKQFRQKHANALLVSLPMINDEPDYKYMENYIETHRQRMLNHYKQYALDRVSKLQYKKIPNISDKKWDEYSIEDIFSISAGVRLTNENKVEGKRPFIGATDNSNGITGFVKNTNTSLDRNVLGVNYNGAPCIAFYHPYESIFTDDVKRFHLLNYRDNQYILLFLKTIIMQQKSKYSYGYKFKEKRMLRQKLMLPVDEAGEPDYEYMEQYAKNMLLKKYKQYLDYLKNKA